MPQGLAAPGVDHVRGADAEPGIVVPDREESSIDLTCEDAAEERSSSSTREIDIDAYAMEHWDVLFVGATRPREAAAAAAARVDRRGVKREREPAPSGGRVPPAAARSAATATVPPWRRGPRAVPAPTHAPRAQGGGAAARSESEDEEAAAGAAAWLF